MGPVSLSPAGPQLKGSSPPAWPWEQPVPSSHPPCLPPLPTGFPACPLPHSLHPTRPGLAAASAGVSSRCTGRSATFFPFLPPPRPRHGTLPPILQHCLGGLRGCGTLKGKELWPCLSDPSNLHLEKGPAEVREAGFRGRRSWSPICAIRASAGLCRGLRQPVTGHGRISGRKTHRWWLVSLSTTRGLVSHPMSKDLAVCRAPLLDPLLGPAWPQLEVSHSVQSVNFLSGSC